MSFAILAKIRAGAHGMTVDDADGWLKSQGMTMPGFLLEALLATADSITPCLIGAGYPEHVQTLIRLQLLTLLAMGRLVRQVSSASSPSGSSMSWTTPDPAAAYAAALATLRQLDKAGCSKDLIPATLAPSNAGLWVATGKRKGCR